MRPKIVLIALMLAMAANSLRGQIQEISTVQGENTVRRTIVRGYGNSYSITYVETDSRHYFCLLNHSVQNPSTAEMAIDPIYSVNDFVVHNDSVFFCGNTTGGSGFVGVFYIPAFFSMGGVYYAQQSIVANPSHYAKTLTAMTVCSATGNPKGTHILCIGKANSDMSCLQDVYINTKSSCGWSYAFHEVPSSLEEWKDIVSTKNYVVVVGYMTNNPNRYICMRQFAKSSLTSTTMFNKMALFGMASAYKWPYRELLAVTKGTSDTLYTAAYYIENNYKKDEGIQIGMYDVSQMSASSTSCMKGFYRWFLLNVTGSSKLRELVYSSTNNGTLLLCNDFVDASSVLRNAVFEVRDDTILLGSSYITGKVFQSICLSDSNNYYETTGNDSSTLLSYDRKKIGVGITSCENSSPFNTEKKFLLANTFLTAAVTTYPGVFCFDIQGISGYQYSNITIDCSN